MKLTSQEEYGLRCLLRLARKGEAGTLTLPEISQAEGISTSYAAKLMRLLRRGGFVRSVRGQGGGYALARPAGVILAGEALAFLGGRLYDPSFCEEHSGVEKVCTNSVDCSIRSLWSSVQLVVDQLLSKTSLQDLLPDERPVSSSAAALINVTERQGDPVYPSEPCA